MFSSSETPVVIIGMHRSGTSMLSRLLEGSGFYPGRYLEGNNESVLFVNINNHLLKMANSNWDNPEAFLCAIKDEGFNKRCTEYIRYKLASVSKYMYWGISLNTMRQWGWKDPRTTLTLPLWRNVFPSVKVIHMYRNGIDVSLSLSHRERISIKNKRHKYLKRSFYFGDHSSARCLTLDGGFSLWETYTNLAEMHIQDLGEAGISVKYEDFLNSPQNELIRIAKFLNINDECYTPLIETLTAKIDPSKAYAFKANEEGMKFWSKVKNTTLIKQLGYDV